MGHGIRKGLKEGMAEVERLKLGSRLDKGDPTSLTRISLTLRAGLQATLLQRLAPTVFHPLKARPPFYPLIFPRRVLSLPFLSPFSLDVLLAFLSLAQRRCRPSHQVGGPPLRGG